MQSTQNARQKRFSSNKVRQFYINAHCENITSNIILLSIMNAVTYPTHGTFKIYRPKKRIIVRTDGQERPLLAYI